MKKIVFILIIVCIWSYEIPVYASEKPLKGTKVVIDAGHGGFDNGAIDMVILKIVLIWRYL